MTKFNKKNYDKKDHFRKKRQHEKEVTGGNVTGETAGDNGGGGGNICNHSVCVEQRKMTPLPRTSLIYEIYNRCSDCQTYWPKVMNRCGHCKKILKTRNTHHHKEESAREKYQYSTYDR